LEEVPKEKIVSEAQYVWPQLGACRQVIDEVAEEFDGEDPCKPEFRQILDTTMSRILSLSDPAQILAHFLGPFDLPDPTEEDLDGASRLLLKGPSWRKEQRLRGR